MPIACDADVRRKPPTQTSDASPRRRTRSPAPRHDPFEFVRTASVRAWVDAALAEMPDLVLLGPTSRPLRVNFPAERAIPHLDGA